MNYFAVIKHLEYSLIKNQIFKKYNDVKTTGFCELFPYITITISITVKWLLKCEIFIS